MTKISLFTIFLISTAASAYNVAGPPNTHTNRRDALSNIMKTTMGAGILLSSTSNQPALALEQCPPKSNNCVRTQWTPPSGSSKSDAIASLRDAIKAYPQEGQNNVDGGGWIIAEDDLDGPSSAARVEFRSSGKGNFAKFLNGGKPFVDDLKIEVDDSGVVQIKSQSRVGDSDFGVNSKRVEYIAASLSAKGWSV